MSSSLLILGSVAIDTIRTPRGNASDQLGGSAIFAALTAKHWCKPVILSAIGADFPAELLTRLERAGLDLTTLTRDPNGKSFRWTGVYDENLGTRETVGLDLGVMVSAKLDVPAGIENARFAIVTTYAPARQLEVLPRLHKDCFVALDTIAVYINVPELRADLDKLVARANLLCIDQTELKQFTGLESEEASVKKIFALGPTWAIIKYGKRGSRLYAKAEKTAAFGIYDNVPKDTTGAGDTFLAGTMAHLTAKGRVDFETLCEGIRLGTAAASITTEAFGVEDIIKATREEIERRAEGVR